VVSHTTVSVRSRSWTWRPFSEAGSIMPTHSRKKRAVPPTQRPAIKALGYHSG
jgi:hypothetical protein